MKYGYDPHRGMKTFLWTASALVVAVAMIFAMLGMSDAMDNGRCDQKAKTRLRAIINQSAPYRLGCYLGEKPTH